MTMRSKIFILMSLLLSGTHPLFALSWGDLWATKNQQAQEMMKAGRYKKAMDTFQRSDWRAAAAYRAGHYEKAAELYQSFNTEQAYYNLGNALAHMGQYEEAIEAYDKALRMNPDHQDALYNRNMLEALLKKDQEKQKQNEQKQDEQKQNEQKQDEQKQDEQKQDEQKQNEQKQNEQKQNEQKQNEQKQDEQKQNEQKQDEQKQNEQNKHLQPDHAQSEQEKQQAKEQWLRLIPDDPGGLMREKFLRDHLRRERGWYE